MHTDLRATIASLLLLSALTGVAYPVVTTGIASVAFPAQAHGSLLVRGGTIRGSALIGQSFTDPRHLWGRPSATARAYDAGASTGSNLGPTNPVQDSLVRARVAALRAADPTAVAAVPVDLVTASGSGLDPHLSPAAAAYQAPRIAAARHTDLAAVQAIIRDATEGRTFGVLGEPRVNVLRVNLALDSLLSTAGTIRP